MSKKRKQVLNTSDTPYLREIIDTLNSDEPVKWVKIQKGASIGITSGLIPGVMEYIDVPHPIELKVDGLKSSAGKYVIDPHKYFSAEPFQLPPAEFFNDDDARDKRFWDSVLGIPYAGPVKSDIK